MSQHSEIPVSHPTLSAKDEMTVTFEPRPFGIQYEGNMITDVVRQSQADIKGVKIGWAIMSVNGETNIPDGRYITQLFNQAKQANKSTTICFGKQVVITFKNGMNLRAGPAYPGERVEGAGSVLRQGRIVSYSGLEVVTYQGHPIRFYQLTDGKGWIHNYNPKQPDALNAVSEISHVKIKNAKGISIRQAPIYPGKRTDHSLRQGLIAGYTHHIKFDYNGIAIKFYKLADGRGWIHNYNADSPTALDTVQELEAVNRMEKQGQLVTSGMSSLFELHGDTLYYFKGEKDQEPEGIILEGANISVGGTSEDLTFTIETQDKKTYMMKAKDENDKNEWLEALAAAMGKEREEKSGESLAARLKRLKIENTELRTLVEELEGHIAAVSTAAAVTASSATTTTTSTTMPYSANPPQRAVWI